MTVKSQSKEYRSIHDWLQYKYGKAVKCENPNCSKLNHKYDWALKRNYKYEKNIENFIQLCRVCHIKYDFPNGKNVGFRHSNKTKEKMSISHIGLKTHSSNKLTEKQVRIIKHALSFNIWGTAKWLTKMCKVSEVQISKIKNGLAWEYITI